MGDKKQYFHGESREGEKMSQWDARRIRTGCVSSSFVEGFAWQQREWRDRRGVTRSDQVTSNYVPLRLSFSSGASFQIVGLEYNLNS